MRARRIKTLTADLRKCQRNQASSLKSWEAWKVIAAINSPETRKAAAIHLANTSGSSWYRCYPLKDFPRDPPASQYEGDMGLWSALTGGVCTVEQALEWVLPKFAPYAAKIQRWIDHYENRIAYETAMLQEAGQADLLKPAPRRKLLPLLNYRAAAGSITTENLYDRGRMITYRQIEMTQAEYTAVNKDYRGTRYGIDRAHRFRSMMNMKGGHELVCVFLTDVKAHPEPKHEAPPKIERVTIYGRDMASPPVAQTETPQRDEQFEQLKASLKTGVRVISAPQLFPTPRDLAAKMVDLADVRPGDRVLEPSAGTGAIIRELEGKPIDLVAVEISHTLADNLRLKSSTKMTVICADFLDMVAVELPFDKILMNPPFENGADIKHIKHAAGMLKPGGILVAICAGGPRQREQLEPMASLWDELPPGTFKSQGTNVNTVLMTIEG